MKRIKFKLPDKVSLGGLCMRWATENKRRHWSPHYNTDIMPEERLVLHDKSSKSLNVDLPAKQLNLTLEISSRDYTAFSRYSDSVCTQFAEFAYRIRTIFSSSARRDTLTLFYFICKVRSED